MTRRKRKAVVDCAEVRRARYLDIRAIRGSDYVVTDALARAAFAQGSAELRAASDKALEAELEGAVAEAALTSGPQKRS